MAADGSGRAREVKRLVLLALMIPSAALADPSTECAVDHGTQIEIADCLAATEATTLTAMETMLGFARSSAQDLDHTTGRGVALPALEAAQVAWAAYREAQCASVGAGYGGGSGTGIAIRACRIELTRARTKELASQLR